MLRYVTFPRGEERLIPDYGSGLMDLEPYWPWEAPEGGVMQASGAVVMVCTLTKDFLGEQGIEIPSLVVEWTSPTDVLVHARSHDGRMLTLFAWENCMRMHGGFLANSPYDREQAYRQMRLQLEVIRGWADFQEQLGRGYPNDPLPAKLDRIERDRGL